MDELQGVSSTAITEQELISRAIPKIVSKGSGHLGVSLPSITAIFDQQFGKPPIKTLNEMIKIGIVTAAILEWKHSDYRRGLKSIEVLNKIPKAVPKGKHLRIYLSANVPKPLKAAQKKLNILCEILREVAK
jgi:hypothetical protein